MLQIRFSEYVVSTSNEWAKVAHCVKCNDLHINSSILPCCTPVCSWCYLHIPPALSRGDSPGNVRAVESGASDPGLIFDVSNLNTHSYVQGHCLNTAHRELHAPRPVSQTDRFTDRGSICACEVIFEAIPNPNTNPML